MLTTPPVTVNYVTELVILALDQPITTVLLAETITSYSKTNVGNHVQNLLGLILDPWPVETVMPDVLIVNLKDIETVKLVTIHMSSSKILAYNVLNVNKCKDTSVTMKFMNVPNVTTTVWLVKELKITVPHVIHQESMPQLVLAQMVSMTMETLVSVVLITVLLVKTEKNVLPVPESELMPQFVIAHLDTMTQVNKNVTYVELNVLPVTETTSVPLVKTHPWEPHQIVTVHQVGKMLMMVSIVLKNHIQKV
jgi:hypothetical protein